MNFAKPLLVSMKKSWHKGPYSHFSHKIFHINYQQRIFFISLLFNQICLFKIRYRTTYKQAIRQTENLNKGTQLIINCEKAKLKELQEYAEALNKAKRIIFSLNNLQQKQAAQILQCKTELSTKNLQQEELVKRLNQEKVQYENDLSLIRSQGKQKEKELNEKITSLVEGNLFEINLLQKEKQKSQKLNIDLQDQLNELKKANNQNIEQIKLAMKKIEGEKHTQEELLNKQIQKLQGEQRDSEQLIIQLKTRFEGDQKGNKIQIEQLNIQVRQLQNDKSNLTQEVLIKTKQLDETKQQMQKLKNESENNIQQLKKQQENQIINQNSIEQLHSQLKKLEQEKQLLIAERYNQEEQLKKQIQKQTEEQKQQEQIIIQLNNNIKEYETDQKANKMSFEQLNKQITQLQNEKQNQKQELNIKTKQLDETKLQMQKYQVESENNFLSLKKQEESSKNQNEELKIKNQQLQQSLSTFEKKIESLNFQLDQRNNENESFKQLLIKYNEEQNQVTKVKQNFENTIKDKNEQINKHLEEILLIKAHLQKKDGELKNMKISLDDSIKINDKYLFQLTKLEEQKCQDQKNIDNLNKKIRDFNQQSAAKIDQKVNIEQQKIVSLIDKPYEVVTEYTKKQSELCCAIAFNREQTIMIAGYQHKITVFEFKQGQLNQKQLLSDHNSGYSIRTLYFMTKYNQFISGTYEEIGIWSYNNTTHQYYCLQMMKQAHSSCVNRVIMNKNEDLIISCSHDQQIKFWIKKNKWECLQTLTNHTSYVFDICLNQSCTQLVSCDKDGIILISQQGGDQKWTVIQTIKSNYGRRICYINDNLIAFQPYNETKMQTYQLNQQNKQFIKYKDVQVQNDKTCHYWFPMQYNNINQLLLNKYGYRINLIRYNNNDFIIEQSINFGTCDIWGAMTDNFQYLVTWDYKSKEFQVRKQK